MDCIDFYEKIVKFLDKKAKVQGVTDLENRQNDMAYLFG